MAHRPQHTLQIMETQTRFDLNAAVANWQQELAAQGDLTSIVRRELETHLRDTVAELRERGLNNEEAFWLARRRVGQPQQLGEEFAKADPLQAWRERTFWMAVALLAVNSWSAFVNQFWINTPRLMINSMRNRLGDIVPGWVQFYLPDWLCNIREYNVQQILMQLSRYLPIVVLALFFARGRLKYADGALSLILTSRVRFFIAMLALFLFVHAFEFYSADRGRSAAIFLYQFPWSFSLIALATWLIPSKNRPIVRMA